MYTCKKCGKRVFDEVAENNNKKCSSCGGALRKKGGDKS